MSARASSSSRPTAACARTGASSSGAATIVADIKRDGMLHVAIVPSSHPAARIVSIDATAALGVARRAPCADRRGARGRRRSDAQRPRYAARAALFARGRADALLGRMGRGGRRRHARHRRGCGRAGRGRIRAAAARDRCRAGARSRRARRSIPSTAPTSCSTRPSCGARSRSISPRAPRQLSFRVTWGRSSTVPIETFGVLASWDPWHEMLDVWASIQMPKYAEQIARAMRLPANAVRVHYDVDVGGSYGVKRGIKHTVLVAHLARKLGRPVRLIEDRLDNMRSGDMHGPERIFDVSVAFDDAGIVRSMKMRALDNVGAYAGRAPFQLGKPIGAIVGPYRIESVQYQALSVMTNKAAQEAVRGFGQSPTNYAIETAIDKVAAATRARPDRGAAAQFHPQGGVPVSDPERHALRQRRLSHRGRQGAGACRLAGARARTRPPAPSRNARRHRDRGVPGAERRQLVVRAAAQSEEHHHDLDGFLPHHGRRARRTSR